jgi:hypothetical protein
MSLVLDDCAHCACYTTLVGYTRKSALRELEEGSLGCQNCIEEQDPDGHTQCITLYEERQAVWKGGCNIKTQGTSSEDKGCPKSGASS